MSNYQISKALEQMLGKTTVSPVLKVYNKHWTTSLKYCLDLYFCAS